MIEARANPQQVAICDAPLPEHGRGRRGPKRAPLFESLAAMTVGGKPIEVNRERATVARYIYRYRVLVDRSLRFIVRDAPRRGWSRVWRVV